jgi:uncharacterized membrane protein SirB2
MSLYWLLKSLHVGSVLASGALFALRGYWMMRRPSKLRERWVRIVPHIIDSVLLASATALVVMTSQYPFAQAWLTAKVLALVAYIVLGSLALKRGRTLQVRIAALAAAAALFGYIVAVALTRSPLPLA